MSLVDFMLIGAVGLIVGLLGQMTSGYSRGGWAVQFGMACAGSFLGTWAARAFDLPVVLELTLGGGSFPVLYAMIGAALGIGLAGFFTRTRF